MSSQAYANYAMGPPQMSFLFQSLASHQFIILYVVSVTVFDFCFQAPTWLPCSPIVTQPLGFAALQPFRVYSWQAYVTPSAGLWPHQECTKWLLLPLFCPQPFHQCNGAYSFGSLTESSNPLCLSLHGREGSSLSDYVPPDDTLNSKSIGGVKPGDFGVVIGYQVEEFTCTGFAECFVVLSHIYHCFTGKVLTLNYFPLEPGCEDYSFFLTRQFNTFSMVLIPSLLTLLTQQELDASFVEADILPSSVS